MNQLRWSLVCKADQAEIQAFECWQPVSYARNHKPPELEAQSLLRALPREALRDAGNRGWRYHVARSQSDDRVAAAFVYRDAPDFRLPSHSDGARLFLLCAAGIRTDLQGQRLGGQRYSDIMMRRLLDDVSRAPGEEKLLLAKVRRDNPKSMALLDRHLFRIAPPSNRPGASYVTFVRLVDAS